MGRTPADPSHRATVAAECQATVEAIAAVRAGTPPQQVAAYYLHPEITPDLEPGERERVAEAAFAAYWRTPKQHRVT